jgi:hypothetical protein
MFLSWSPMPKYDESKGEGPETTSERKARWTMAAQEADRASHQNITPFSPKDNQALIAVVWKYESALEFHVHGRGEKSPLGSQDGGRAVCFGQIHQNGLTKAEHCLLGGRDRESTRRCAEETLGVFLYHAEVHCKMRRDVPKLNRWKAKLSEEEVGILFSAYAQGNSCVPLPWIEKRVGSYQKWRDEL